ncbi:ATP-dependent Clp protease ATP-binding subunit ClpX [uncultured archaeon]|nr:ATP-dependent Clp protease ATP-binding subunit ClpX [uncultured archaeon]
MEVESREVWIGTHKQMVGIKKFSPVELIDKMMKFPVETFVYEKKYVSRIVDMCWIDNEVFPRPKDASPLDRIGIYKTILEVNPLLCFVNYQMEFPGTKRRLKKTEIIPEPKKEIVKKVSLEEIVSIADFEEIERILNEEVIGQKGAVKQLLYPLINAKHMGMSDEPASFYLLGPSGVGKTSSIKCLSKILDVPLLQIQGSEYQEEHTSRSLFGAPPSYLGHDPRGGILSKFITKNPNSIILFDEIDKVHPQIYGALTSFLSDGFVSIPGDDSNVYFNGWIFFTSNTGNKTSESGMGRDIGFHTGSEISDSEKEKQRIIKILKQKGVGEAFLGRMNGFIGFDILNHENLRKILDKKVKESNERLKYYQIELTESAKDEIISAGEPNSWGARNIVNNLNRFAISELNYAYEMERDIPEGSEILVDYCPVEKRFIHYTGKDIVQEISVSASS